MRLPGGSVFSPPKPPALPPPVPVPTPADPAIEEAKRRERLAARRRKGRAALVLAGEAGDLGDRGAAAGSAAPGTAQLLGG
jgi:hypothetical protein